MPVKLLCILGVVWAGETHPAASPHAPPAAPAEAHAEQAHAPPGGAPNAAEEPDVATATRLPTLRAPDGPQTTGELVSFVFEAPDARPVYVDGCTPIDLEIQSPSGWVREPAESCSGGDVALIVDRALTLSVVVPRPGTWRAAAAWGTGCRPKTPFAYASCSQTGTARSASVRVTGFPLPPERH